MMKLDVTVAISRNWLKYWPELSKSFRITAWRWGFISSFLTWVLSATGQCTCPSLLACICAMKQFQWACCFKVYWRVSFSFIHALYFLTLEPEKTLRR